MLAELLDRIPAVLEDPRLAVDVRDRAATRRGVHVRRVVGHQPESLSSALIWRRSIARTVPSVIGSS